MGAEFNPFGGDPAELAEAEDLVAAAVGKDGASPAHEGMEPSHLPYHLRTWPQVKVIGVDQDRFHPQLFKVPGAQGLDAPQAPHGHEDRRADLPVGGDDLPDPGARGYLEQLEGEAFHRISIPSP